MRKEFKTGDIIQHFKRGYLIDKNNNKYIYKIICIGQHTETGEDMVVYQSLEDEKVYIRPYDMFYGKTDKNKYPNCKQEYRFEILNNNEKED